MRTTITDLGLPEKFDDEIEVPPVSTLSGLETILREVELFHEEEGLRHAMKMMNDIGFGVDTTASKSRLERRTVIGVKRLLSLIEMARQEPMNVADRLQSALMGLEM